MPTPLRDLARTERDAYLATLKKLVELESPTADKSANDALAQHLQTVLEAQSWQVERVPKEDVGDQLIALVSRRRERPAHLFWRTSIRFGPLARF